MILTALVFAATLACPEHFFGGVPPRTDDRLGTVRVLCYNQFAVGHSGVTATPLFGSEHLTRREVGDAGEIPRKNTFHAEPRLPRAERAELHHYQRSGYDRGHVVPAGDMPDERSKQETFTLANIVPQDPDLNRGVWSDIEQEVRRIAVRYGEAYVVTLPLYKGDRFKRIGGRVLVPTHMLKAVYVPSIRKGKAYVAENTPLSRPRVMTIAEAEAFAGANIFGEVGNPPLLEPTRTFSSPGNKKNKY